MIVIICLAVCGIRSCLYQFTTTKTQRNTHSFNTHTHTHQSLTRSSYAVFTSLILFVEAFSTMLVVRRCDSNRFRYFHTMHDNILRTTSPTKTIHTYTHLIGSTECVLGIANGNCLSFTVTGKGTQNQWPRNW